MTLSRLREIGALHLATRDRANDARRLCVNAVEAEHFRALAFTHHNAAEDLKTFADTLESAATLARGLSS
jgi:hypothetical protein